MESEEYRSHEFVSINQNPSIPPPPLDFLPKNVKIEASSSTNGLLCCTIEGILIRYLICKPATKQWRMIPNPKTCYSTHKNEMVVQSSAPLQYKIIRFSRSEHNIDHLICEIFDLRSWRWRPSNDMEDIESLKPTPEVLTKGSSTGRIFSFHVDNEKGRMHVLCIPQEQSSINEYEFRRPFKDRIVISILTLSILVLTAFSVLDSVERVSYFEIL
ncbi:hypothetical protein MRB53_032383 [Persea americana]|uniref:Uncharacterized protein n=1 Tax=Persea americana TaxID=3435 RepID=A0ACC2KRY8_PERAE|nr:hypothetical protein MRB53_032383 [Persea americana]